MNTSEKLNTRQLAEEILNSAPNVIEYSSAPSGAFFKSHTKAVNHRFKVRSYVRVKVGDEIKIMRHSNSNVMFPLISCVKKGWIDAEEARNIPQQDRCTKCGGKGYLEQYAHVENGVCFKCGGHGV